MIVYLKQFVQKRSNWVNQRLLNDLSKGDRPKLHLEEVGGRFLVSVSNAEPKETHFQWRIAEIQTQEQAQWIRGKYEIEGSVLPDQNSMQYQLSEKAPGTFRIRARRQNLTDRPSRWSLPIEIVIPPVSSTADSRTNLGKLKRPRRSRGLFNDIF
jgi:hypothetical protein